MFVNVWLFLKKTKGQLTFKLQQKGCNIVLWAQIEFKDLIMLYDHHA